MKGWWFSHGMPVSSTNKIDCHDLTEILLKITLNTINHQSIKQNLESILDTTTTTKSSRIEDL